VDEPLLRLGLTAREARAYRALLAGPDGARSLGERIGASYPGIYRVLGSLTSKGWLIVLPGRPRRYAAVPASTVLAEARARLFPDLVPTSPDIAMTKGLEASLARAREVLTATGENAFAVTPGRLDREMVGHVLSLLSGCGASAEWYLNTANAPDLRALRDLQAPRVRALPVIPRPAPSPTRLEHTFLFAGRATLVMLDAAYREGRLDADESHALFVADPEVVRVQLEALVESTRALARRPVPVP